MLTYQTNTYITEQEYLDGEKLAKERHEYIDWKIYAMADASRAHSTIAFNVAFNLRLAACSTGCEIYLSDIKVHTEHSKAYYYPDVVVSCNADETNEYYLNHPCLIVEVTSKSTEWKDHHEKTLAYQKINSLKAYLIVAQDSIQVTYYYRDAEGMWDVRLYDQLEQIIPIPCPEAPLSVAAIYEGINFTSSTPISAD